MNKTFQKIVTSLLFVAAIAVVTTQVAFGTVQKVKSYAYDHNTILGTDGPDKNVTYVGTPEDVFVSGSSRTQVGSGWNYVTYRVTYQYYSPHTGGFY